MEITDRGIARSRSFAQRIIMAGDVFVNGQLETKPSAEIDQYSTIEIKKQQQFVSRGGEKLKHALIEFQKSHLNGWICADVGASTGGFTDCLLQSGANKVYAIDVGYGQLDWRLRQDMRVIVMERTNARMVQTLPEKIDLVVIDASFISLKTLLPIVKNWLQEPNGEIIALIKPQFEVGRKTAAQGKGVIRDPQLHLKVLLEIATFSESIGFKLNDVTRSPLLGPKGNREFLMEFRFRDNAVVDQKQKIQAVVFS